MNGHWEETHWTHRYHISRYCSCKVYRIRSLGLICCWRKTAKKITMEIQIVAPWPRSRPWISTIMAGRTSNLLCVHSVHCIQSPRATMAKVFDSPIWYPRNEVWVQVWATWSLNYNYCSYSCPLAKTVQIHLRKHKGKDQVSTASGTIMTRRGPENDQIVAVGSGKEHSRLDSKTSSERLK